MCDPVEIPLPVGCEVSQKRQPERLNSSTSVSDLSEAASDMSLSTSPGSDLPVHNSKDLTSTFQTYTKEAPSQLSQESCPGKRSLVRKLSSNPYPTSSDTAQFEDQHQILGTQSYTIGENMLYKHLEVMCNVTFPQCYRHTSSPREHSNPLTSDCPDESDEDDEEEEDSSNDEKLKEHINLDHILESKEDIKSISTVIGSQSEQSYPEVFSSNLSSVTLTDSSEIKHHNNHPHQYHHEQQYNQNNHLHQQQLYRNSNIISGRSHTVPPSALENKVNGYKSSRNENEIYSLEGEPHSCASEGKELRRGKNVSAPDPPKSREINSWGHFHKPSEGNYRYRRSHYSSDSEEEDTATLQKPVSSRLSAYKSHLCGHSGTGSPIQSPSINRSNPYKTPVRSSTERQVVVEHGIKPQEFKERLMLMKKWFLECNDGQKNLVLKGLLDLCELPQHHLLSVHMSKELHHGCPSNCEDIITWLPRDLALKVMSYLDPVSLCHAAQVCRVWRQLAEDQSLWCRFCCQTKWRLSKAAEHKQVISHMCPEGSIQWKNVFAERFRLRNNWLKGRCTVRTFEGHMQGISCVQFDDSRIVSGSSDKTIKVWNMRTNAPWSVQTLMGHHGTVRCLYLEGNRLVSGSCDKTIKVWDLSTQESWSSIACKVTMTGHTDTVRCLQADDDKVISGSYDTTLKIWDLKSGALRRTLRGHQASVLCVHFSETKIVSGSADKAIKVWNYEGNCMMTLRGHQDAVTCLMFDSTRIVSGSLDHNLKFWDIHTGECLNTIDWKKAEGHTDVVRCLQADSWRVVSAADDKTIKVWNLATGERLVTLRNHTDGVTCLQFNDFIIVSGSYDKSVKLWDFSCC